MREQRGFKNELINKDFKIIQCETKMKTTGKAYLNTLLLNNL